MKDVLNNTGLEMRPFLQDSTFNFSNLKHLMLEKTALVGEMIVQTSQNLRDGITYPATPVRTFPISEMEKAFHLLQTGKHTGKTALRWTSDEKVSVL